MNKILIVSSALSMGLACVSMPTTSYAQFSAEELLNVQAGVAGIIENTIKTDIAAGLLKDPQGVESFYRGRNFEPFWVSASRPKSNARDLVFEIEESWRHGLNPYSYHLKEIRKLMDAETDIRLADLDVLLSDAYLRLGQDLTGIRVNPAFMNSHYRHWQAPMTPEALFTRLDRERDVEDLMDGLAPKSMTYARLQDELERLLKQDAQPYESVLPIKTESRLLYPGERDKAVPDLRLRLGVAESQTEDPYLYDDRLAAALLQFQRDNGLKDDGIVGGQTLGILNQAREDKIEQIIANLERLRWVEDQKPDTFVIVNIPSAKLWAVKNGEVKFDMPVVVWRSSRPTNFFRTEITGVRLNPTWTVPPTIKREDIVPKLLEDPEYLTQRGMQLISGQGEEAMSVDPASVDWQMMTPEALKALRMVQIPGRNNPLGQYRVHMPNSYNIYLHDTNEQNNFIQASRAISSGCLRMKEPKLMTDFILEQRSDWNEEKHDAIIATGATRDLYIQNPIPVYLLYYTVWINEKNEIVYGNDLYKFDRDLIKMLKDIDGIFIPVDNT